MFEAEKRELADLQRLKVSTEFKSEVAPKSICIGIVEGLSRLLGKVVQGNEGVIRVTAPHSTTLQEIATQKERYMAKLAHVW